MNESYIEQGYILLARKLRQSPLWKSLKATHRVVMIEILLQAQFKDAEVAVGGEILYLKRGQLATSYQQLVNDIGDKDITVKVVRNAINKLVKHDFLAKDEAKARAKKGLLLTIVNYDTYQDPYNYKGKEKDKETDNVRAEEGQSEGKEGAINNNVNNAKNSKNDELNNNNNTRDSKFAEIVQYYEKNLMSGFNMNEQIRTTLINLYDEWGFSLLAAAMKIAAKREAKGIIFVERIMDNWREAGVKTFEDAERYEQYFKSHQKSSNLSQHKEVLPKWYEEELRKKKEQKVPKQPYKKHNITPEEQERKRAELEDFVKSYRR